MASCPPCAMPGMFGSIAPAGLAVLGIVIPGIARSAGAGADVAGMFFPGMPGSLAAAGGVVMSIPGMDCVAAGLAAVLGEVEGPRITWVV